MVKNLIIIIISKSNRKQQEELEKKLKQLEEQQLVLEKEASIKNSSSQMSKTLSPKPNPDSGNDQNYSNDTINNSSLTQSHSFDALNNQNSNKSTCNSNQGLSDDDLKRIEYQKYLLNMINSNSNNKRQSEDACSGDKQIDTIKLIEDRKKEIQKNLVLTLNQHQARV